MVRVEGHRRVISMDPGYLTGFGEQIYPREDRGKSRGRIADPLAAHHPLCYALRSYRQIFNPPPQCPGMRKDKRWRTDKDRMQTLTDTNAGLHNIQGSVIVEYSRLHFFPSLFSVQFYIFMMQFGLFWRRGLIVEVFSNQTSTSTSIFTVFPSTHTTALSYSSSQILLGEGASGCQLEEKRFVPSDEV